MFGGTHEQKEAARKTASFSGSFFLLVSTANSQEYQKHNLLEENIANSPE